ncbi:MAG: molybdopterin-dependent oxidoreductase [Coriobacteriaceae bacterium]|jgi:formate dehydrogenase major subunit|nr:molybdopterin-dependent oxidoreductase [Coriobacteriaceae bacterium]
MTNHWCDLQNADVFLTCGSNNVENHPISSKWVQKALDKGATWIVVDPRYTRSAACADIYCPIRAGTDIAFYGGMFNYIVKNDLMQKEYVANYTNASYLIDPDFSFDVNTGLFSGWDEGKKAYATTTWGYQTAEVVGPDTSATGAFSWTTADGVPEFTPPSNKVAKKDPTLEDPQCVFQVFKRHYERYDLDTVCSICGMDRETLELVYKTYCATGSPEKSGTIMYALGQTQHHYGTQNTRALTLVQLLLGNVGVAGGGVNALRGEPNVQGATDLAMLVYDFPGYMKWPTVQKYPSLRTWMETETASDGYYTNKPKFFISALKEWFGENATSENDFGYDWLPKIGSNTDLSIIPTFEHMDTGLIKGYWLWGQNPAHSAPNAKFARQAMSKLDWMVCVDITETETASFWKAPDLDPAAIGTEVYLLPAALIYEKFGTVVNSGRWLQWRNKAVEPFGQCKTDLEICDLLWKEIVGLYKAEGGANPDPILNMKWDYHIDGKIDARSVAMALNGYTTADKKLLGTFGDLKADGSTSCALWIYAGFYANNDAPLDPAQQRIGGRGTEDKGGLGLYQDWAYAWPLNRRIVYNRASADTEGRPWNANRMLVAWDGEKWDTNDVPDFVASTKAGDGTVTPVPPNNKAYFMNWEQNARLMVPSLDMPLPEHYEPFESPTENILNGRQNSPCIKFAEHKSVQRGNKEDYPIAVTTYTLVEHWQSGSQTRNTPVLVEAMPAQFVEISEELAEERGIKNGDRVRVFNNRGSAVLNAFVTCRLRPLAVNGKTVHQIGIPHHWGWAGSLSTGDLVNDLAPNVGDPNCFVPEYKAFLVDIEKV